MLRVLKDRHPLILRLVDEEWFFKTHIIIESEGGHVISSLEAATDPDLPSVSRASIVAPWKP